MFDKDAILAEYNVTLEELGFEITEDMTEEEFRHKIVDYLDSKKATTIDENINLEELVKDVLNETEELTENKEVIESDLIEPEVDDFKQVENLLLNSDCVYVKREEYEELIKFRDDRLKEDHIKEVNKSL
jgi:hypothetical protein